MIALYADAFATHFARVQRLDYDDLGWGDEEVIDLIQALDTKRFTSLESLRSQLSSPSEVSPPPFTSLSRVPSSFHLLLRSPHLLPSRPPHLTSLPPSPHLLPQASPQRDRR